MTWMMITDALHAGAYLCRRAIWGRRGHHASPDQVPLVEALAVEAGQADAPVHLAEDLVVRQVDLDEAVSVEDLAEAPVAEAEPVVDKCIIRARLKNTLLFLY